MTFARPGAYEKQNHLVFSISILCDIASLACRHFVYRTTDQGKRCLRTTTDVLMTCTGAGELGFWEVLRARPLGLLTNTLGNHYK